MRDIIFRGMNENKQMIEGYFFQIWEECFILWGTTNGVPNMTKVDPATVGQFTGLCDKNGVKIFEGDVVTYPDGDGGYEYCDETINSGVVTWGDESALFYITNNYSAEFPDMWDRVDEMEVIGNIHDNEELLKEEAE